MLVTIAICTRDRAESLRRALTALAEMTVPSDAEWEVVAVNNDSTDHTDTVIESFADRLPIRQEFEFRHGLSHARNRAVEAARGDYIIWIDDDVVVGREWLTAYVAAFRRRPDAAVFGGPVMPRYVPPMPKWFASAEPYIGAWVYARRDVEQEEKIAVKGLTPLGPNFALRAAEQRAFRYDPELGHGPGRLRRGEETDVITAILEAGASGYWVPGARAEHWSEQSQYTLIYIKSWFASLGEAEAYRTARRGDGRPLLFGAPRWRWRQLANGWTGYVFRRLVSSPAVWIPHFGTYTSAWSAIKYWRRLRNPVRFTPPTAKSHQPRKDHTAQQ
jgi:glucosyl-dolichyl phosphate glucuronosyltransferase